MPQPVRYDVALLRRELSILWLTLPLPALGLVLMISGWALVLGLVLTWRARP
jgi:hypothetical protein